MLVAMVTLPGLPASATISASRWCCLALSTLWSILRSWACGSAFGISTKWCPPGRAPFVRQLYDFFDDGVELLPGGLVNEVFRSSRTILAVGGDHHYVQFINLPQFAGFRLGGTGHTDQLVVHAEVVLKVTVGVGLGDISNSFLSLASRAWCRCRNNGALPSCVLVCSSTIFTWFR